ncbi:MAG: FAD-dependent oxidoreductase [Planctomycetota bacterium]|jgi:photolyase PhrII
MMDHDPAIQSLPKLLAQAIARLPPHLLERIRVVPQRHGPRGLENAGSRAIADGPVVYWTHHAQRVDENPAFDVARILAAALDRPLLVYQGLSQRYRYASDRHHLFQLQSARALDHAYRELGIRFALHVETCDDTTPSLLRLAQMASVMVTEDFPGEPTDRWVERIARVPDLPLLAVDTACVVPMRLVQRAFDRAFAFRDATKRLYAERIDRPWPAVETLPQAYADELPFAPVSIESADLEELVARCQIDHGVAPVADTIGGSVEGYRRWENFVAGPLKHYAAKRNDPLSGVASRMSAYLHYGMVSPMRLTRDASARKADKYLDELLIWRELAYGFCFYRPEYATTKALPAWALRTLQDHESDPRSAIYSWDTLARGRTEDRLWNACQESLLRHGELHNNVRMTWGKALLSWTRNAHDALELLIDLNHRYALDGRDPASYGGILWCLGQFDRPFDPEQPVLGTVRDRPTREHAQRLRLDAYEDHVRRPISGRGARVAVIGAGIAGCMCARTLADHGVDVVVFEKSRGPSGRCATRRIWETVLVDHGAPFAEFTDRRWDGWVRSWQDDGVIAPWIGTVVEFSGDKPRPLPSHGARWVGIGGMNAIGKHLGRDLVCKTQTRVLGIEACETSYRLQFETSDPESQGITKTSDTFDAVVFAIPAEQLPGMLPESCSWRDSIPTSSLAPCWTMMAVLEKRWELPFDGARCVNSAFAWLGRESSKPGRPTDPDTWVIQMEADWSARIIDHDPQEVAVRIVDELGASGFAPMPGISHQEIHRWRYAKSAAGTSQTKNGHDAPACYWDRDHRLGACGDWTVGTGIEGALESGRSMAGRILTWLTGHGPAASSVPARSQRGGYIQKELF